jgi:hypothetical protein
VVYDSKAIILLISFYVMFFAFLGYRLFKGTPGGVQYFDTYANSCFNMFVLLTTANSPDIMLPSYEVNRAYSIFFITYLLFGVFVLLSLLMALIYFNYQARY